MSGQLSTIAPHEQHEDNAWQTPDWLVERIHALLGGIELDPCTTVSNPCSAERFFTPADDGILQPWNAERIYVNPPYGRTIGHWVDKCALVAAGGAKVVSLVPARVGSRWFLRCWETADELLFFNGRLNFKSFRADGHKGAGTTPATFPSALFGWNISLEPLRDCGLFVRLQHGRGEAA